MHFEVSHTVIKVHLGQSAWVCFSFNCRTLVRADNSIRSSSGKVNVQSSIGAVFLLEPSAIPAAAAVAAAVIVVVVVITHLLGGRTAQAGEEASCAAVACGQLKSSSTGTDYM